MAGGARTVAHVGAALCAVGLLLVAFVAYQIWGSARYESQAQARLRRQLSRELGHRPRQSPATGAPAPASPAVRTGAPTRAAERLGTSGRASTPAPAEPDPPIGSPVGVLTIPAIGLDDVIVEGVGASQLDEGPGHYPETPLPGELGNVGIAGHRTTYARPFYDLNLLHDGDAVDVRTPQGSFRYTVVRSQVVPPTDVGVLAPHGDQATLTLTTCNPRYSAATRLVVTAVLTPDRAEAGRPAVTPTTSAPDSARPPPSPADGSVLDEGSQSPWPGILWGAATLAVALSARFAWRRGPRRLRWAAVVIGVPLVAGGLLLCFEHLSLALPASF